MSTLMRIILPQHLGEQAASEEQGHHWLFGLKAVLLQIKLCSLKDLCSYLIAFSVRDPLEVTKSSQKLLVAHVTRDAHLQMPSHALDRSH